jgi:hypothetical protein
MTEDRTCNNKITKIKEVLPILWSSYEHMYQARETHVRNNMNFLLIVVSFLPVICLALCSIFKNRIFLIPTLFQVASLLILLKSFFVKGVVPWLEFELVQSHIDDDTFEIDLFAALKAFENITNKRMQTFHAITKRALILLIFSIFLVLLMCLFMFLRGGILLYVFTTALLGFIFLAFFYKKDPSFKFKKEWEKEYEDFKNHIEKWLKGEKKEKNTGLGLNS